MSVTPRKAFASWNSASGRALLPAMLSMAWLGAASVITGALLPVITVEMALDHVRAGTLTSSPAVGYVAAALLAGAVGDRLGYRQVWLAGAAFGALALLGVALAPGYAWLLGAVAAMGLVSGLFDASVNPIVTALSGARAGGTLNRVHLFFGVGASAMPLLVALGLRASLSWRHEYAVLAALAGLIVLAIASAPLPSGRRAVAPAGATRAEEAPPGAGWALRAPGMAHRALALLLYGGIEAGLFAWTALYLREARGVPAAAASLGVAALGGALMVGRWACSRWAERIGYRRLIVGGAWLGGLGVALALALPGPRLPWIGLALAGLAYAGIFATAMADATRRAPGQAGTVAGLLCASSGLGKIALPYLIGRVAQGAGLPAGMILLVVLSAALGLIYLRA